MPGSSIFLGLDTESRWGPRLITGGILFVSTNNKDIYITTAWGQFKLANGHHYMEVQQSSVGSFLDIMEDNF